MNIFSEGLRLVDNGERFHVDFEKRTLTVGRKKLIDTGIYDVSQNLYDDEIQNHDELMAKICELYRAYKYSLPSERSDNKRKKYFKALPIEELSDEQLICGEKREVAQYTLEAFILCAILNGDFVWDDEIYGKWFYQNPTEADLVILKKWIENN